MLFFQIEAILNSRTLTPMSSDSNDLIPLTLGHFLIGNPLISYPQPSFEEKLIDYLVGVHRTIKMTFLEALAF